MAPDHAVPVALWLGIAFGAYICARLTKPDRNYWPMMRVIWTVFAVIGALAGVGAAMGRPNTPGSRITFAAIILAGILYSIYFMRQRNRTARYLPLNLGGQVVFVDRDHLRQQHTNIVSLTRHGATPPEWVPELEEALAEWHRQRRWKEGLAGDIGRRKATQRASKQQEDRR